jgi:hypothetical protein
MNKARYYLGNAFKTGAVFAFLAFVLLLADDPNSFYGITVSAFLALLTAIALFVIGKLIQRD